MVLIRRALGFVLTASTGEHAPDFYINATDDWLVLPYELTGLTKEDIEAHKPGVKEILDSV